MRMRLRLLELTVIGIGVAVLRLLVTNWIESRMDEQITKEQGVLTDAVFAVARWGIRNPLSYTVVVIIIGALVIGVVTYVGRVLSRPHVSIDGVDFYLI